MIYVALLVFVFLLDGAYRKNYIKRKTAVIIICIAFILVAGLRNPSLGMRDMLTGYLPVWRIAGSISWKEMFTNYVGNPNSGMKDVGFAITVKLLRYIASEEQFFVFISGLPYICACSWMIYKYSKNVFMSFFLFITLNLFSSCNYLVRHVWAGAFLIIAFHFLINRQYYKYLLFVVIAITYHSSAVFFLLAYPVQKYVDYRVNSKTKKQRISLRLIILSIVFVVLMISLFARTQVRAIIAYIVSSGTRFAQSGEAEGALGRFGISVVMLIVSLYEGKSRIFKDKETSTLCVMSLLCALFYSLMPIIADFHRVAKFYEIGNVILYPYAIQKDKRRVVRLVGKCMTYLVLGIYAFERMLPGTNALPYLFFWE